MKQAASNSVGCLPHISVIKQETSMKQILLATCFMLML
jgi:hypothetical protein